jgi:hypothetical protein
LGVLALCAIPMVVLVFAGLIRRFQIARTERELQRMGFVGDAPYEPETRRFWPLVEAGVVGVIALIVATLVLPGPPAGRVIASTDGSSVPSAAHVSGDSAGTHPSSQHTTSQTPGTTQTPGSPSASPASSAPPATDGGSDAGAPSTVTALPTSTKAIQLQWAPVSGAISYHVERSTNTVAWKTVATTDGAQTQYTDAALSSGTTYYYRVAALVDGQDVARSDVVSATTSVAAPAAPVLLTATGSATSVDLEWGDVEGELGYRIERSPDGTTGWTGIGSTGQDVTSYTDTGLASTTTYYYRVVTVTSDGGSSSPSNVLSATTGPDGSSTGGPSTSGTNAAPPVAPTGS